MESAELIAILREVRDRVRARHPGSATAGGASLPDLEPMVRARDAAMAKVAAIGSVNPRPGGPLNLVIQTWKRLVARALDWHVREQVLFNRKTIACVDAAIEALEETRRTAAALDARLAALDARLAALEKLGMEDMRTHWAQWESGFDRKLAQSETQILRTVADLQASYAYRADLLDASYRDTTRGQHADFTAALERSNLDIQKRLWADLDKVKLEYERLIYTELRLIRQRLAAAASGPPMPSTAGAPAAPPLDYARFAERFRGPEEEVKARQRFYLEYFSGKRDVLDLGCGRGEFLELMREAGTPAVGIDASEECVEGCRQKGLAAERADLFAHLEALPESSLEGIFCSQVVEHIPPGRLPELIRLCATRLSRNGVLAIETPNPECLAIFASHFFLDPTHVRPVPHQLLAFYMEENGVGVVEVRKLAQAVDTMPSLASLPEDFREAFFGGLDYAIIGKKL